MRSPETFRDLESWMDLFEMLKVFICDYEERIKLLKEVCKIGREDPSKDLRALWTNELDVLFQQMADSVQHRGPLSFVVCSKIVPQ